MFQISLTCRMFSVISVSYYSARFSLFVVVAFIAVTLFSSPLCLVALENEILISVSLFTWLNNEYWFILAQPCLLGGRAVNQQIADSQ